MWLWRLIQIGIGYLTSYLKVESTSPNLFSDTAITRGQLGRFYWINLFLVAFAIYRLFLQAQLQEGGNLGCSASGTLPFLGVLVLAELASLVFLLGSWLLGTILSREELSSLYGTTSRPTRLVLRQRLHRLVWGAFPWVLIAATLVSAKRLTDVIQWCGEDAGNRNGSIAFSIWITLAAVWPGLVIATIIAACITYFFHRFKNVWIWSLVWIWAFFCYVIVLAIVGPGDVLHIVEQFRDLRGQIDGIFNAIVGQATTK